MTRAVSNSASIKVNLLKIGQHVLSGKPYSITLRPWEELVGRCSGFSIEDESLVIIVTVNGQKSIIVMPNWQNASTFKIDRKIVGHKVGIIQTGDSERQFVMRKIRK